MRRKLAFLLATFIGLATSPAFAWGACGHRAAAAIAILHYRILSVG